MRRLVLILLLLVYPFQVTLAMADGCCMVTARGVTHHAATGASGRGVEAPVLVPMFVADDTASSAADPHCPSCVLGQIAGVPVASTSALPEAAGAAAILSVLPFLSSAPPGRPERPNWPPAAL